MVNSTVQILPPVTSLLFTQEKKKQNKKKNQKKNKTKQKKRFCIHIKRKKKLCTDRKLPEM